MKYDKKELNKAAATELNSAKWAPKSPEAASKTAEEAEEKASVLGELAGDVITTCSLVKDAAAGDYRAPWSTVAMLAGALLYFISPVDLIPDFIPFAGWLDDISVVGLALKTAKDTIDDYKVWKKTH